MARIKQIKKGSDPDEIEIGDQVKHSKFGVGTVLYKSGSGDRAKAIVVFSEEGQKKMQLKYAKLKKVKEPRHDDDQEEISEEEIIMALNDSVDSDTSQKKSEDAKK
jgi:PcrA/UvrD helicase-like protein